MAASPYAKALLKRKKRIVADDYRLLKSVVKRGVPKVVGGADVIHLFSRAEGLRCLQDREAFLWTCVKIYREEIRDLAADGCTYLQLDDPALPCNCDAHARQDVVNRGENPDGLTERYAKLFNEAMRRGRAT